MLCFTFHYHWIIVLTISLLVENMRVHIINRLKQWFKCLCHFIKQEFLVTEREASIKISFTNVEAFKKIKEKTILNFSLNVTF